MDSVYLFTYLYGRDIIKLVRINIMLTFHIVNVLFKYVNREANPSVNFAEETIDDLL